MVNLYNERRLKVIDLLPKGWRSKMAIEGAEEPTVWPDEATVYAGNDSESLEVLERRGLATEKITSFLKQKKA